MISFFSHSFFRFSSANISAKTYAKFQEKYTANVAAFKSKTEKRERYSDSIKKSTQKPYEHPFDNINSDLTLSPIAFIQAHLNFYGGEQVSAHYQNFGMARRQAIVFWIGYFGMRLIADTPDFHFFADTAALAWLYAFGSLYFFTEGKKSMVMPILNRFYRKIAMMQINNLHTYYNENMESKARKLMAYAKAQIDYKTIHNQYISIRNNSLLTFLINEQIALKNHLYERAANLLVQAESIQNGNKNKIISEVMSETLGSIDKAFAENREQIEREMFELALEGIAKGKMDYAKDPVLPHILKTIQKIVDKFSSVSVQDQKKMVTLTTEQLQNLRTADARARDEFLLAQPKIEGSLKTNDTVARILSRWGKE